MSIETVLHTKTKRRSDIQRILNVMGYRPCGHLWDWPKGSVYFHWFNVTDFLSYDGVEATVYKPVSDHQTLEPCEWALHTRTRGSASPADQAHQDNTIRAVRAEFGGDFYNDWHGRNRYTRPSPDQRDAVARGIYLAYEAVSDRLKAVRFATPNPSPMVEKLTTSKKLAPLAEQDPTRVLYNALVPFAVASLESFFSQSFKILLRYDDKAPAKLAQQSRKVEMLDVLALSRGERSLEDIVANWYSFQNLDSIHKAFSDWLHIDFWKIIRSGKRRRMGSKIAFLEDRLNHIIQFRHGIIHRLEIDTGLDKREIDDIFATTLTVIDAFVDYLEASRGKSIRD